MRIPNTFHICLILSALALQAYVHAQQDCNGGILACPPVVDPVCGSNGHQYNNECEFQAALCAIPELTAIKGPCPKVEDDIHVPDVISVDCPMLFCMAEYDPVCGTDGKDYSNKCELDNEKCQHPELRVDYEGPCKPSDCPEFCMAIYDPVCGSDSKMYPNECELRATRCRGNLILTVKECEDGALNSTPVDQVFGWPTDVEEPVADDTIFGQPTEVEEPVGDPNVIADPPGKIQPLEPRRPEPLELPGEKDPVATVQEVLETVFPTDPNDPIEPVTSTDEHEPVTIENNSPHDPILHETVVPIELVETLAPVIKDEEPVETVAPVDPDQPVETVTPVGTNEVETVAPVDLDDPVNTEAPVDQNEPVETVAPVDQDETVETVAPDERVETLAPVVPDEPVETQAPVDPDETTAVDTVAPVDQHETIAPEEPVVTSAPIADEPLAQPAEIVTPSLEPVADHEVDVLTDAPVSCERGCTLIYLPLCASNGQTYGNLCLLTVARCEAGDESIIPVSAGECATNASDSGAVTPIQPPTPDSVQLTPWDDGFDQCGFMCPMFYDPVCTKAGQVYENRCHYASAICHDPLLPLAQQDFCDPSILVQNENVIPIVIVHNT